MKIEPAPHAWSVSPKEAVSIQRALASKVIRQGRSRKPRLVAGADLAFSSNGQECIAGVVVWDVQAAEIAEQCIVIQRTRFPYVPGLLSFREAPAVIAAFRKIKTDPDVFIFDGQGYAHPRRFGLACHVGIILNRPSIGCAKSVLIGEYDEPELQRGSQSPLIHQGHRIGMAVRSRDGIKPVFVSVGHLISLQAATRIVQICCTKYRLPEPTRLADKLVAKVKLELA